MTNISTQTSELGKNNLTQDQATYGQGSERPTPPSESRTCSIDSDGNTVWLNSRGIIDRPASEGPAVIYKNSGAKAYYTDGQLNRADEPALIYPNGTQHWYIAGRLHRAGDQPASVFSDGRKEWWYLGKRHRLCGPAVIFPDGFVEYWIDANKFSTKELFDAEVAKIKKNQPSVNERSIAVILTQLQVQALKELVSKYDQLQTRKVFTNQNTFDPVLAQQVIKELTSARDQIAQSNWKPMIFNGFKITDADLTALLKTWFWDQNPAAVGATKAESNVATLPLVSELKTQINDINNKIEQSTRGILERAMNKMEEICPVPKSSTMPASSPATPFTLTPFTLSEAVRDRAKELNGKYYGKYDSQQQTADVVELITKLANNGIIPTNNQEILDYWIKYFLIDQPAAVRRVLDAVNEYNYLANAEPGLAPVDSIYLKVKEFPSPRISSIIKELNIINGSLKVNAGIDWIYGWEPKDIISIEFLIDSYQAAPIKVKTDILTPLIKKSIQQIERRIKEAIERIIKDHMPTSIKVDPSQAPAKKSNKIMSSTLKGLKEITAKVEKNITDSYLDPISMITIYDGTNRIADLHKNDIISYLEIQSVNGNSITFGGDESVADRAKKIEYLIDDGTFRIKDLDIWARYGIGKDAVDYWRKHYDLDFYSGHSWPDIRTPIPSIIEKPQKKKMDSRFKSELTQAGYRVAGTQLTNSLQNLMVKAIPADKAEGLKTFLKSEIGSAFVSMLAGMALTYSMPDKEIAQKLATEFRVNGLATFGNAAIDGLLSSITDVVSNTFAQLPQETTTLSLAEVEEKEIPLEEELGDPLDTSNLEIETQETRSI